VVWEFTSEIMSADQYHLVHCFPALREPCRKRRFHNRKKVSTLLHACSVVCMRGGSGENILKSDIGN